MSRGEEIIESILKECGYELDEERPRAVNGNGRDSDSPFRDLNEHALKNLDAWVPDLGIYKCQGQRGRYRSYRGVAQWRTSTKHGTDLDKRDRNLSICSSGIRDFGDDRRYTPIDLVMAAKSCDLRAAVNWLDEKLGWSSGGPEIDIEAIKAKQAEREAVANEGISETAYATESKEETPQGKAKAPDVEADEKILKDAGAWVYGSAPPPPPACSFEKFLPLTGVGTLVSQYGCHKTHILVDLSVAFAAQAEESFFAGRRRLRRGGVLLIEFENSGLPVRIACAAEHRGEAGNKLPIIALPGAEFPIITRKKVNPEAVRWYRAVLGAATRKFQRDYGVPLVMVGIDPLVDAADFDDENSSTEGNRAMKAFDALSVEFGCIFAIADHAGKDIARGSRGTSAKPGKAHFILTLPEKVADNAEPRTLTIKKLRGMPDGWGVEHWLRLVDVETSDGELVSNLAVCWGKQVEGEKDSEAGGMERIPRLQLRALRVLEELNRCVTLVPRTTHVPWISLEAWYEALVDQTVIEPKDPDRRKVFKRIKDGLHDKGCIKIHGEKVCIPL